MNNDKILKIDGKDISYNEEKNLLEVIRKANIELPTFCYHSELSVYGACRLCLVEIKGRGLQPACSTPPAPGLEIETQNKEIRNIRKIIVELLLANEGHDCTICPKSGSCQLQNLARKLGIKSIRFKKTGSVKELDETTHSIVKRPDKCILCGDCVRMCNEVQGVGAIDFAYRGKDAAVVTAFNKDMNKVECVYCGQCARVCPTGAITIKSEVTKVWNELDNKKKFVVAQLAPAVRVALGEEFGLEPGTSTTGLIVASLKAMGFDKVYDTSFSADMTVIEEGNEFINRLSKNEKLPLFTSCCPAWVKYVEQYYPEYIDNLSTCKSPQAMFSSLVKEVIPDKYNVKKEDVVVISIMPCTAKKYEAKRDELKNEFGFETDHVITTQELARMIEEMGLDFKNLKPESFDLPFGFKTGAGIIFGNSGGVTEAVLRYVTEEIEHKQIDSYDFKEVRPEKGLHEIETIIDGKIISIAIASGLSNVKKVINKIKRGEKNYHLVEVMACPDGCIGGAGQPVFKDRELKKKRNKGIYETDKMIQLHKSQENPYLKDIYTDYFDNEKLDVHKVLHTHYRSKKRIITDENTTNVTDSINVNVCFGTGCFIKGSQGIMKALVEYVEKNSLDDRVNISPSFCFENCGNSPNIRIEDKIIENCTPEKAIEALKKELEINYERVN